MPVHPQAQAVLDQGRRLAPMETLNVAEARKRCLEAFCTQDPKEPVKWVQDRTLQLEGHPDLFKEIPGTRVLSRVPVRIYTPDETGRLPVLVYFHGGGFVVNSLDTHDAICRHLANRARCLVVSVDYARAPEYRFPTALMQCFGVTKWLFRNLGSMGKDVGRIAVGGDSSGGTLAAGVALMARDMAGPPICSQVLIYPALDHCRPGTPSYTRFSTGYSLTRPIMQWFFDHYLPTGLDKDTPYLFPARSNDLSRLPPALIVTAEYDPLRDEGENYAKGLARAGGTVTLTRYPGMIHGFVLMHRVIDRGREALDQTGDFLKQIFVSG